MAKKVAVIGAGATGMAATKACLEQGLEPVVFEKTNYTGGLWRYQEQLDKNGIASVMRSTIVNTSKEMTAFTDFPPPAELANFMHHSKLVGYFDKYANNFNFKNYVRYLREVTLIEMAPDYEETGRWVVSTRDLQTGQTFCDVFDGVMLCTGHHGTISMPTFEGQESFKGKIMHTHSLKHADGFEGKRVVIVGIGNSAADAAVELATVAQQVYMSTRRGTWISKRVWENGLPADFCITRRCRAFINRYLPYWLVCSLFERKLNQIIDHDFYQLRPQNRCFSQLITTCDALPIGILSGKIQIKSNVDHFTEDGVVFQGENKVTKCDAVIFATGYKVCFPFLPESIVPVSSSRVHLYRHQFAPSLKHPHTLAFIGLVQPTGAIISIGEMQARWFALLMKGKVCLPSRDQMESDIEQQDRIRWARYYKSERNTLQCDWLATMDFLAQQIGAFPPLWRYLFTDFSLFKALFFGPAAPYQYRLVGPNAWKGARQAILTLPDRVQAPLLTNQTRSKPSLPQSRLPIFLKLTLLLTSLYLLICYLF